MASLSSNITLDELYTKLRTGSKITDKISYSSKKTDGKAMRMSIGRVIVNEILPEDFELVNEVLNAKVQSKIFKKLFDKYGPKQAGDILSELQLEMFKMASMIPSSFNINGLTFPDEFKAMKDDFKSKAKDMSLNEYNKETDKLTKYLLDYTDGQDLRVNNLMKSGVKGDPISDWKNLMVAKGFVIDIEGNIKGPILNGVAEGFSRKAYYDAAAEARRDFFYKSTMSAEPGYLARKIVMANSNIVIDPKTKDCETKKYYELYVNNKNKNIIIGRTYNKNGRLTKITEDNVDDLVNNPIKLRSPLYCKAENGICQTCYGDLFKSLDTSAIGVLAGGAVNKVALNDMMKMKHKASQVNVVDIDFIDIIKKSRLDLKELSQYLDIEKKEIKAKVELSFTIDKNDYKEETEFLDCGEYFATPGMLDFEVGIPPNITSFTLPFAFKLDLYKPQDIEGEGKIIKLHYKPGETITKMNMYVEEVDPGVLNRLFDGGAKYIKTPEGLVEIISGRIPSVDLCHIETIVANMFRRADDDSEPCRKRGDYKNAVIYGQKKLPFITSWLTSLSFENVNKAIEYGLISGKHANFDPFEKIVLEKFGGGEV